MENGPRYPLSSVDNALELLLLLKRRGHVGVSEAARALGVAKSTAHRLLAMLSHHGFAVQDASKEYRAGEELNHTTSVRQHRDLELALHPYLVKLAHATGETANTQVLEGRLARIIDCVPGTQPVCVGDRRGITFRPESVAGGQALLALMSREEVAGLYLDDPEVRLPALFTTLARVRRQGFALNLGNTEPHIRAVGVAVRDATGVGVAALVLSVPRERFGPGYRAFLAQTASRAAQLAQAEIGWTAPGRIEVGG